MTGSHEARGSIPLSSTSKTNLGLAKAGLFFVCLAKNIPETTPAQSAAISATEKFQPGT